MLRGKAAKMKAWKAFLLALIAVAVIGIICGAVLIHRGFRATTEPSGFEKMVARAARDWSIPGRAQSEKNPLELTSENLREGREEFLARCASCHGHDGSGLTDMGRNLYPRTPDLRSNRTQNLSDGEIHYIIANGVQLTGMPAWSNPHQERNVNAWNLVLFIRSLRPLTRVEKTQEASTAKSSHYVGSQACEKCHEQIYDHWKKTPMANIVRDPREHPDAITPNLATNNVFKFTKDQVAFVYGSIWKQRYFTKIGDDYYPLPVQWEFNNKKWSKYFAGDKADWWAKFYPPD
ncbi:MAG: c-type cytochrome, partial [Candidatus Sulfotelmatobacter sp.]